MTPKQKRFVAEYLSDMNATQAAIRAGYSARSASQVASANMGKHEIAAAIAAARAKQAQRLERTADDVLIDIRRRGQLAEAAGDFGPALKAAELEGRHLQMFTDRVKVGGDGTPVLVGSVRLVPLEADDDADAS